jgi:hypothetical protein
VRLELEDGAELVGACEADLHRLRFGMPNLS